MATPSVANQPAAAPTVELVPAQPEHVAEIGRICYQAFKELQDRHRVVLDFPSVAVVRRIAGMLVSRPDFYGVTALCDGEIAGSNFLFTADSVAAIGPITVDPAMHGRDIGRAMMEDVIQHAHSLGMQQIRLVQETCNTTSLSLYASLGFDVREELALMQAAPAPHDDSTVRPVTPADLDALQTLSTQIYKTSRRNEVAAAIRFGFAPLLREVEGQITGYLIPGQFGHGVARTEEDALAIIGQMARRFPAETARFFLPLSEASFFRALLKAGCRTLKLNTLMTMGPYEAPGPVWLPSVLY
jgi:ribosomal protein S18 acetylase RimI-like enzyme